MGGLVDITGYRYGRLTVKRHFWSEKGRTYWMCVCDCGNEKVVIGQNLKSGNVKSCGCLPSKGCTRHGMRHTRFYKIWSSMVYRAGNEGPNIRPIYKSTPVCERWKVFENFRDDMYSSYLSHASSFGERDTTIERINNALGYYPENCTWATYKEQARNRRRTCQ